ncbi:hypothetical protein CKAN_02474700 [Cinnamomum micranthum f. kanehirae]|uniref:Uncharacterized protein n=1 Tax=Cinnamomum micranthum f. kanehirae TaxID=337451 RepID=A0A3S3PQ24_9MAGN|nr:hypothetical protein CKAN_02474700 [Cinnamomum micranthum f. kanehirae]
MKMMMEMEMEMEGGGMEKVSDSCATPKHGVYRIPTVFACPPPPKKKAAIGKRDPPKDGYYQPPDLELIFKLGVGTPPQKRVVYFGVRQWRPQVKEVHPGRGVNALWWENVACLGFEPWAANKVSGRS